MMADDYRHVNLIQKANKSGPGVYKYSANGELLCFYYFINFPKLDTLEALGEVSLKTKPAEVQADQQVSKS